MRAISESEKGLPKLVSLHLDVTGAGQAGGAIVKALGSGKVPSLKFLCEKGDLFGVFPLYFDAEGLPGLIDALREGSFPSGC